MTEPASLQWTLRGASFPHGAAQQAWFDALRRAAAGHWQRVESMPAQAGTTLRLMDSGTPRLTLLLIPGAVVIDDDAQGRWRADIDTAPLEALLQRW